MTNKTNIQKGNGDQMTKSSHHLHFCLLTNAPGFTPGRARQFLPSAS
jgi:hypothetical protein